MNSLLFVLPWVFASVAIGMAIGFYLGVARGAQSQTDAVEQERERTLKVLSGLVTATEQLTSDVNVRNIEIRDIGQNIGKLDLVGELPEIQHALMTQVTRVLESNLKLEDYLTHTQCQVEEQTQEIERADKALYEPKEQAQNKPYCFGDEELGPRHG